MKYLIAALLLIVASTGCAGYDASPAFEDAGGTEPFPEAPDSLLYAHDVAGSRAAYEALLGTERATTADYAGHAVTEALALPLSPEFNAVLTEALGAIRPLDNDLIYGDDGLLYLVSLGVPYSDGEDLAGIETLLAERLPWSRERLATPDAFVDGLSRPVDLLADKLVALADGPLARMRESAGLAARGAAFSFFVPGAVFHDEALEIVLGPADLALLDAAGGMAQGAIYLFGAYANAWTLERAFGSAVWDDVIADADNSLHIPGGTVEDYQIAHLNEHLLRVVRSGERLSAAGDAFQSAFGALAFAVETGPASDDETTLQWSIISSDLARDLARLFRAVESSFDGPTAIPFVSPTLTVDLRPLFTDGRTIPAETNLLVKETYADEFGEYTEVILGEDAMNALVEGLTTPSITGETEFQFTLDADLDVLVDDITGDYATEVDRAYSRSF